jgi:processive 1,2-diacylglycerol beta-glucosyltransferase
MKHILILSAAVGAGHMRAAQAVELAARQLLPDAVVRNVDVLTLTNAPFRRLYGKAYLDLVNRAPHVLGYFYDMMDKQPRIRQSDQLMHLIQKANLSRLIDLLDEQAWDLVINTHFLPAEIIASRKKRHGLKLPQVTVTTDFETHRLWVAEPSEHYFTATQEGCLYLQSFGISPDRVSVTGIPIHPAFAALPSRKQCLQNHGLLGAADRPILLQLAGGFGVGPIAKVHQALLDLPTPIELVTICGKNQACLKQLEAIPCPSRHRRHLLGFTQVIHELMAVADVVVSKPGGLTSSECLAAGAPMLIINPIPGQESRNADYLLEQGAAIKANNLPTLAYKMQELLANPAKLKQMKADARRIGHPRAAFDIVQQALTIASTFK